MGGVNVAGPAMPLSYHRAVLDSDQTTGGTAGTPTVHTLATASQFLNGLIDVPTSSRIRALFAGHYRLIYGGVTFPGANSRGWEHYLRLNGTTQLDGFRGRGNSVSSTATRGSTTTTKTGIILLAANDYIEFLTDPIDNTAVTVQALSHVEMQLVRLT